MNVLWPKIYEVFPRGDPKSDTIFERVPGKYSFPLNNIFSIYLALEFVNC